MPSSVTENHLRTQRDKLQRRYDTLTKRIAALDIDIGRELDSMRKFSLEDRRAMLLAEREQVAHDIEQINAVLREAEARGFSRDVGPVHTGSGDFIGGDQIIISGPVATHGSAINTGGGTAFAGNGNVVITGKVDGDVIVGGQRPPGGSTEVTRYTDIHAPARAQAEKRFPVIVGLACRPSPESASVQAFELRADLPVQVRLGPTSLEVLGERVQELTVHPEQDSEPVVFYFKGHRPGPARIILDFLQGGNFLGQLPFALEITAGPVDEVTERVSGQRLRLPSNVPAPDRILFIHYDRFEGQPSLFFTLDQAGAGSRTFPSLPLETDPAQDAARLYDGLTSLQARGARGDLSSQDVEGEVRQLGWNLWRDLIPPRLQDLYAEERAVWSAGSLLIVSDEPYFPWELVWPYDRAGRWQDQGPWCVTLALTRWLGQDGRGNGHEGPPGRLHLASLACLASSRATQASAPQERDRLRELASAHHVADLSPELADTPHVRRLLTQGEYDWLHVATHGGFIEDLTEARSGIRLENGGVLKPEDLVGPQIEGHIGDARPGFFFNTCHGGRQGWALTRLGGWANRLIGAGAGLFIAPLWTVDGALAMKFADAFYGRTLEGQTIAVAGQQARRAAYQAGDPTWLAYSIYAHPNARVAVGQGASDGAGG